MFKNAVVFRFSKPLEMSLNDIASKLAERAYRVPDKTQPSFIGFESPLAGIGIENAPMVVCAQGRWLLSMRIAVRAVKAAELKARVADKVAEIESAEMRKVYRKEREVIKDEVFAQLLPNAFPEESVQRAYISPLAGLLVVEAGSTNSAEQFCSILREALGGLPLQVVFTGSNPEQVMSSWLIDPESVPEGFSTGDDAELIAKEKGGESRVKFKGEDPAGEEAVSLLKARYTVKYVALSVAFDGDPGMHFTLTDQLVFKAIKPDGIYEDHAVYEGSDEDFAAFKAGELDAKFILFAGTFEKVFVRVVAALGGYEQGREPAAWVGDTFLLESLTVAAENLKDWAIKAVK
jgi:recombination associated protein RdgC